MPGGGRHLIKVPLFSELERLESALGGTRTPNLLIRSQMLYPLSYKRLVSNSTISIPNVCWSLQFLYDADRPVTSQT